MSIADGVSLFEIMVDAPSRVGIKTLSHGGGRLADGPDISPGRFDPILTLVLITTILLLLTMMIEEVGVPRQ